ncbi:MAG: ABC transporter ATP-binding protein [Deltaproteobacteria bacterium]|nr:ABC transporter ATP-binding protein [Deltaproteobacteria bacterium]
MLKVDSIRLGYGDLPAVRDASLELKENQIVSLLGSNGAGKTTLIRAISGLLPLIAGSVHFEGRRIDRLSVHQIVELGLIQVPEGRLLFPDMTVLENLEMGGYSARARSRINATIENMMNLFPAIADRRSQLAGTLSGGEQQMLAIGRALMAHPKLLMLDEPSLGLAPLVVAEIFNVIDKIRAQGCTLLLVEQNVFHALSISDFAYVIENGEIVMQGEARTLRDDACIKEAYLGL